MLSFGLLLVLARNMSPDAFADVAVLLAWIAVGTAIANLSMPMVIVKVVASAMMEGRYGLVRGVVALSSGITLVASVVLVVAVASTAAVHLIDLPREVPRALPIVLAILPSSTLLLVVSAMLQGFKRVVAAEVLVNVLRPVVMLVAIAALALSGTTRLTTSIVMSIYLFATVACLITNIVYAGATMPRALRSAKSEFQLGEWRLAAKAFLGILLAAAISERIDLIIMGLIAPAEEVAVYAIAARFAQTLTVALTAVATVMAPHLVEQLAELRQGRRNQIQALVSQTTRTMVGVATLGIVGFAVLAPFFLPVFGSLYEAAYVPLLIVGSGRLLGALFGPALAVATFAGETRLAMVSLGLSIIANALLSFALVPILGAKGAALATATGIVIAAVSANLGVSRRLGIETSIFGASRATAASSGR